MSVGFTNAGILGLVPPSQVAIMLGAAEDRKDLHEGRGAGQNAYDDSANTAEKRAFRLLRDDVIPNDHKVLGHCCLLVGDDTYFGLDDG